MSISSISSNADYYQNYFSSLGQQNYLADSSQSSDLNSAQSAFSSLMQVLSTPSSSANSQTQS